MLGGSKCKVLAGLEPSRLLLGVCFMHNIPQQPLKHVSGKNSRD